MITAKEVKKFIKRTAAAFDNGSPFSALRENEIVELERKGRLFLADANYDGLFTKIDSVSDLCAVYIARECLSDATHRDFAQRTIKIKRGTVFVSDVFVAPEIEAQDRMCDFIDIADKLDNMWLNVECYAEDEKTVEALKLMHFERAISKVSAFAEVKTIYTNTEVDRPSFDPVEDVTLAQIASNFISEYEKNFILAELDDASDYGGKFANHYSIYNKDNKWSGITLRGYDKNDPSFIEKPTEMSKRWKKDHPDLLSNACEDTIIAPHFAYTLRLIRDMFGKQIERVRILKLDEEGTILRHCDIQDRDAGIADGKIARFHIPLQTHENVVFKSWDADGDLIEMKMPECSLCYLDHRKPHSVVNAGGERLHLVIDVFSDARIRNYLREAAGIQFREQEGTNA